MLSEKLPSFGVLSDLMKDHVYFVKGGLLFTSPWVKVHDIMRRSATILLTARGDGFEAASADGVLGSHQAVAIKAMAKHSVCAENVRLVLVRVHPIHPHFKAFRSIPQPGLLALPRERFAAFNSALDAAYCGQLPIEQAARLYEDILAATLPYLPKSDRVDPRVERALELLQEDSNYPLEGLAAAVGLSYCRMSYLFSRDMGISLRSFQLGQKVDRAVSLFISRGPVTDFAAAAGFSDLSHLSRVFQQSFGAPLSYFLNPNHVKFFYDSKIEQEYAKVRQARGAPR